MIAVLFAWWLSPLVAPTLPSQAYHSALTSYASLVCTFVAQRPDGSFPFTWTLAYTPDETVVADSSHVKIPSDTPGAMLTATQRTLLATALTARGQSIAWLVAGTTQRQAVETIGRWHEPQLDVSAPCGHP